MKSAIRFIKQIIPAFLVLFGIAGALPAQAAYTYQTVDYPGAVHTQLWGISSVGQVVGVAYFDDFFSPGIIFVYDSRTQTFTVLPDVPGVESTSAIGINKSGVVVGRAGTADGAIGDGLIIANGAFSFFSHSGSPFTEARGISDSGLIAGYAGDNQGGPSFGFIYNPVTRSLTDFLPSTLTIAHGINKKGQVVGSADFPADGAYPGSPDSVFGFMRNTNGVITLFQVNGNNRTRARGITGTGRIAGFFNDGIGGKNRGFVGTLAGLADHVLTIPAADVLDVPGSIETFVEGMEDAGRISGFWVDNSGFEHGFLATPIPPKKK